MKLITKLGAKSVVKLAAKLLVGAFALLLAPYSYSAQSVSTKIYNPYSSIRAMGMGNAFTAVADDYSLIMYNPAGFSRKKNNEIQVSLLGAGVSAKTLTIAGDIDKASKTTGTDADKAQAVSDVLEQYYGQSLGGKLQALELFWVRNGWGIALLPLDMTIDMSINRQLGPAIDLNIRGDTSIAFGFGKEITKYIDAGLTLKYVHRVSVEEIVPAFELATDPNVLSDNRFREGTKTDFDLGFMWRPNWFNQSNTDEFESVKVEPALTTPEEPKVESKEEPKKEEPKASETKTEEKKVEEERKPQAEGDAKEVKVAAEDAKKDTKTAETSAAITGESMPPTPAVDTEIAKEKNKVESPQKEEAKLEEVKTIEVKGAVPAESEEKLPLTLGLVIHNVIGGEFTLSKQVNKSATEVPTKMHRVIDIGSQYLLRDGEDFKVRYMLDFKNALHPEITLNKSFHTGIEFDYSPNTWFKAQLRAGLNQGYYTAGASFLFAIINIDVATYGEEVGSASSKLENRVLAAKLGFNF